VGNLQGQQLVCSGCGKSFDIAGSPSPAVWYYARNKQKVGPFPFVALQELTALGELQPSDMVWQEGTQRWIQAGTVPGLFLDAFAPPPPPALASEPAAAAALALPATSHWTLKKRLIYGSSMILFGGLLGAAAGLLADTLLSSILGGVIGAVIGELTGKLGGGIGGGIGGAIGGTMGELLLRAIAGEVAGTVGGAVGGALGGICGGLAGQFVGGKIQRQPS
jgi:hypothetical protein